MNSNDPLSSDFAYKKYSLEQLDNWLHDALDCEDLTPQDIYDTIVNAVDENIEYHKKYLTKNIELLSLLKGQYDYTATGEKFPTTTGEDWEDFWSAEQYTEEEMDAMCDAASDKEKCREYNLREAEYYNKRAELDANQRLNKQYDLYEEVKKSEESNHSKYYFDRSRNKTYDQMIAEGWTMTADGFWIKETDKGTASVSAKPDPYREIVKAAGGYDWTPKA